MISHVPLLGLILLAMTLLFTGCQETSAPAASSSQASQTDVSGEKDSSEQVVPSPDPPEDTSEDPGEGTGEIKPAHKPADKPENKPAGTRDYTFDDLKFDIEKGGDFKRDMLTDKIEAMVDTPIRIRGYILPSFQQTGLKQFVLVRDNMECCFGPGAALFDCILVEMSEGKSADFSVRPVAVEGKFSINEFIGPDGKHLAIYHLQGESVK